MFLTTIGDSNVAAITASLTVSPIPKIRLTLSLIKFGSSSYEKPITFAQNYGNRALYLDKQELAIIPSKFLAFRAKPSLSGSRPRPV